MPYDLEPVIREAVSGFGGWPQGLFNTAQFQHAVRAEFELRDFPDSAWCVRVLEGTDYVERLKGWCHWRYLRCGEVPSDPAIF